MPRLTPRQQRVETLLRAFIRYRTGRLKRARRRTARQWRALRAAGYSNQPPHLPSASDSSSESLSASSDSDSDSTFNWLDVLGPDWRGSSDTSESSQDNGSDSMPTLASESSDSDDSDDSDGSDGSDDSDGSEGSDGPEGDHLPAQRLASRNGIGSGCPGKPIDALRLILRGKIDDALARSDDVLSSLRYRLETQHCAPTEPEHR